MYATIIGNFMQQFDKHFYKNLKIMEILIKFYTLVVKDFYTKV